MDISKFSLTVSDFIDFKVFLKKLLKNLENFIKIAETLTLNLY
ncbi:hypothetical protein LCGC14_1182030 [marine sediment metagenome]|uniref:Uncharacterized protein n=1 Tax=marine sediment metagenome TaxID=412755 RepID=A0A0F9LRN6_9ZZZZ